MTQKPALMCLLLAAVSILSSGCASTLKKPYFWKAEKAEKTLYLFGTIHIGVPYEDLPNWVIERLDRADAVAFELNVLNWTNEDEKRRKRETVFFSMRKKGEPKLSNILSARAFKFIMDEYGSKQPQDFFDLITPYAALGLVATDPNYEQRKVTVGALTYGRLNSDFSLDLNLLRRSTELGKPITELDKIWKDRRACEIEKARTTLEHFVAGERDSVDLLLEAMEHYRSGETAPINAVLARGDPSVDRCLLFERNRLWLPQIEALHQKNRNVFVAVGLAHVIYGQDSLLRLLEQNGYRITRLKKD